jgi:hypothetical protein
LITVDSLEWKHEYGFDSVNLQQVIKLI